MKNKPILSFLIVIFFLFSLVFISNETKGQDKDSTDTKLKDKISLLEKKIQNQQDEIEGLKKEIDKLKKTRPWLAVPKIEGNDRLRKGRRFEFNGQVYYMIPLNSGSVKNETNK